MSFSKMVNLAKNQGKTWGFENPMPDTCWDCKNNTLKLKVLVPYNHTIKEYVHRTGNFQSDIVAVIKGKQGQYTVWFRSVEDIKLMPFEMLHTCALRIERTEKQADCPCHKQNGEKKQISNIIAQSIITAKKNKFPI